MKFKEIPNSATFDFISSKPGYNSFFDRCIKTGPRTYASIDSGQTYTVGSINCEVYNVTNLKPFNQSQWEVNK